MAKPIALVTFGIDPQLPEEVRKEYEEKLAVYKYPVYLWLLHCRVIPIPSPTVWYDKPVVKLGSKFKLQMWLRYAELLGDLGADYVAEFHCHNIATREPVEDYCVAVEGKLKCDTTWLRIETEVEAVKEGLFCLSGTFHLPKSEIFDFTLYGRLFAVYDDKCVPPGCHIHYRKDRLATVKEG